MIEALALGFGLSMDVTAIAAVRGMTSRAGEALLLSLMFAVFHVGMAALGWALGAWGADRVARWDHWIAFGLLVAIGGKMILEAVRDRHDRTSTERLPGGAGPYLVLGFATSLDAAAAGVTLPLVPVAPWIALSLIGGVTLVCSLAGHAIGRIVGRQVGAPLEVIGGGVLVALGVRVLVQHL